MVAVDKENIWERLLRALLNKRFTIEIGAIQLDGVEGGLTTIRARLLQRMRFLIRLAAGTHRA